MSKLPRLVTVYRGGRRYDDEAPEEIDVKPAIADAIKRTQANIKRHEGHEGHADQQAPFIAELADLKGETPPAPPGGDGKGEKGKGKGKADK
jgi:hypothetical protein